jgi:hypothetical protein
MFLDELSPLVQEFTRQPVAFLGGLMSGVLRLNLADDPVRSWLDQQAGVSTASTDPNHNGKSGGPQSITIE